MPKFSRFLAFGLASVFLLAPFAPAFAANVKQEPFARVFYYRDGPNALASLKKNYRSIDILAPQSYSIDGAGNLTGEAPKDAIRVARAKKIDVVPLVTNGAFEAASVKKFLLDEDARAVAVDAMVAEAEKRGYAGWQIDFEQVDASLKDEFTAFVAEAERALQEDGRSLSVAVVAKVSDVPSDYPNDLWQKLIGVYDYEALGEAADFISVMSYDEPYKTGPVSPYPWLERVLDYTLEKVPAEKISLGVPTYYWEREVGGKNRIMEIGGAKGVAIAKKERGAKTGYDEEMKTAFVKYRTATGEERLVWHESRRSIQEKLLLAVEEGLHGISVWALGLELPETHRAFQAVPDRPRQK
jgi:spore germination protein YaaH